jgi:PAS domain-containing protein
LEVLFRTKKTQLWANVLFLPIIDLEGNLLKVVLLGFDLTLVRDRERENMLRIETFEDQVRKLTIQFTDVKKRNSFLEKQLITLEIEMQTTQTANAEIRQNYDFISANLRATKAELETTEVKLANSRLSLDFLLENSTSGILLVSAAQFIIMSNNSVYRMTGFGSKDIANSKLDEFFLDFCDLNVFEIPQLLRIRTVGEPLMVKTTIRRYTVNGTDSRVLFLEDQRELIKTSELHKVDQARYIRQINQLNLVILEKDAKIQDLLKNNK